MTEENKEKSEVYEFANCVVDADRRELSLADEAVTVQPKAFEPLLYLIRNRHGYRFTADFVATAKLMGFARTNAGEGWNEDDAARLAQYRDSAGTD